MKPANAELTEGEKERFREIVSLFPENDSFKKGYICEESIIFSRNSTIV